MEIEICFQTLDTLGLLYKKASSVSEKSEAKQLYIMFLEKLYNLEKKDKSYYIEILKKDGFDENEIENIVNNFIKENNNENVEEYKIIGITKNKNIDLINKVHKNAIFEILEQNNIFLDRKLNKSGIMKKLNDHTKTKLMKNHNKKMQNEELIDSNYKKSRYLQILLTTDKIAEIRKSITDENYLKDDYDDSLLKKGLGKC